MLSKKMKIISGLVVALCLAGSCSLFGAGDFFKNGLTIYNGLTMGSGNIAAGGGKVTGAADPTSNQDYATKNYVDTQLLQLNPAAAVYAASTANISGTYSNAVSGVCIGDTFTTTSTATFTVDGQTPTTSSGSNRVLFKNQTSSFQDGVWVLTTAAVNGVSGAVFTRATDMDSSTDFNAGQIVPIANGSVNAGSSYYQTAVNTTCNTSTQTWTLFQSGSSSYQATLSSSSAPSHQFGTGFTAPNTFTYAQPAFTDISGNISAAQMLALTNTHIYVGNGSNQPADVALSGDATISNTGALTLATVNSNVGSFTNVNITVNAKGLITAASTGSGGSGTGSPWVTSTSYVVGNTVTYENYNYICVTAHTSGTFETDYQSADWVPINIPTDNSASIMGIGNNFENNTASGWTAVGCATVTSGLLACNGTGGNAFSASNGGRTKGANTTAPAATATTPISGKYSLNYATSGAGTAGDMYVSQAFNVDPKYQGKVMAFQLQYKVVSGTPNVSGTSSNTYATAVYDVTDNTWLTIQSPFSIAINGGTKTARGLFKVPTTAAKLQIAVYNPTAPSGTSSLYLDDISMSDTQQVNMRYHNVSATQNFANDTIVNVTTYDTKDYDIWGAFNTSTGIFTCPMNGKYKVVETFVLNATAADSINHQVSMLIYHDSTEVTYKPFFVQTTSSVIYPAFAEDTIDCESNGTINPALYQNTGGTMTNSTNDAGITITIERVGD